MNKKIIAIGLAIVLLLSLGVGGTLAAENPKASAKATAQITDLYIDASASSTVDDTFNWDADAVLLLEQTIKTANMKDLFIDVSLLSGLYTETNVKSKGGNKDTSGAGAAVIVAVFVDDVMVFPGYPVVFNARVQVLSAKLQGIIDRVDLDTGIPIIGDPEEIGLIIATMSANSFNFIFADLSSGMHTVEVFAAVVAAAGSQAGSAKAKAAIGLGSVTIEEVRMIKGEEWLIDQ